MGVGGKTLVGLRLLVVVEAPTPTRKKYAGHVKMGSSSPIFGVTIQKIFELPAPSLCLSLQGFFTSLTPKRWIHFPGKNMCLILQTWEIYSIWAYGTKKPGRRETMVVNGPLHSINLRGLWLENGP